MRVKSLIKSKKLLVIALILVFMVISLFLPNIVFAGTGNIDDGTVKKLNLNLALLYDAPQETIDAWESAFKKASELLYNSTEGQMQIGTVNVYINKPFAKLLADIWVTREPEVGTAESLRRVDLGHIGRHIRLYQDDTYTNGEVTIVHEMGHYVFGLRDEYTGVIYDINGEIIEGIFKECGQCTGDPSAPACFMDASRTVNNNRTEWCTPISSDTDWNTEHNQGGIEDDKTYVNFQQLYNIESCWETIVRICEDEYGITMTIPSSEPSTVLPSGYVDINWNIIDGITSSRVVLTIDRSKSMRNVIDFEKLGAHEIVDLTKTGEELGIVSFSNGASINFSLQEIVDDSTKENAHSKINKIYMGDLTNIYAGLETALNQIKGRGETVGNEIIILLTDGVNTTGDKDPLDLIPDLIERGVKVYTIGMGGYPNTELLKRIAKATGGCYFYAKNADELRIILRNMSALQTGSDIINTFKDTITTLGQIIKSVFVDIFNEEVTFMLEWKGSDLDLTLKRPDGTIVDPTVAQTDPDIEYVERDKYEFYRIKEPMAGEWQFIIDAIDVTGEEPFAGGVIGETQEVMFYIETDKDKDYYIAPEEILIQALVAAEDYVANAEVTGTVVRPDGTTVDITLFDDGLEIHGDELANDGMYSNFFSEYAGVENIKEGVYTFNMIVENKEGIQATGDLFEEPPEGWTPEPIDPFTREASVSVYVYEIPPTELTLDFPSSIQYSDMLSGKATLTSQGIPLENMPVALCDLLPLEFLETNASGEVYNTPYKVEEAPRLRKITAIFYSGGDNYLNTMAVQEITIEKENATLIYIGDTLVPVGADTTLSCQVIQEDDGYPGDITRTSVVTFDVTTDKGFREIYKAAVGSDGVATITAELPDGVYKVATSLGSYYFFAVPPEEVTLIVGEPTEKAETEISLDFPSSIQYSDMLSGKATLTSLGTLLANMPVEFSSMLPLETLITNENGEVYSTPYKIEEASGMSASPVCANFYGDSYYLPSYNEQFIEVEKEGATLTYIGDTLVPVGSNANLSCQVTQEDDGYPGDITYVGPITFTLTTQEGFSETYTASVGSDGIAAVNAELPVGLYKIVATIDSNYYTAPPSEEAILAVYDQEGSFVTGGGWFVPQGSDSKINFGFEVKYKEDETLKGNLEIIDHNTGTNYKANDFTYLVVAGSRAYIKGNLTIDGEGLYPFTLVIEDNGSPGKDSDKFSIDILVDGSHIVFNELIGSGNIVIHK